MWSINLVVPCILLVGIVLLMGLWLVLGPGPVRARAYTRARRALDQGDWQGALTTAVSLQSARLPPIWQEKVRNLNGEARQAATAAALKEKQYEAALEQSLKAASVLGTPEADARAFVVEAMLAELRKQFAGGLEGTDAVLRWRSASLRFRPLVQKYYSGGRCANIVAARSIKRSPR